MFTPKTSISCIDTYCIYISVNANINVICVLYNYIYIHTITCKIYIYIYLYICIHKYRIQLFTQCLPISQTLKTNRPIFNISINMAHLQESSTVLPSLYLEGHKPIPLQRVASSWMFCRGLLNSSESLGPSDAADWWSHGCKSTVNQAAWTFRIRKVGFPKLKLHSELEAFVDICLFLLLLFFCYFRCFFFFLVGFWTLTGLDRSHQPDLIFFRGRTFSDTCGAQFAFHCHNSVDDCITIWSYSL